MPVEADGGGSEAGEPVTCARLSECANLACCPDSDSNEDGSGHDDVTEVEDPKRTLQASKQTSSSSLEPPFLSMAIPKTSEEDTDDSNVAICVRNAHKHYGRGRRKVSVLSGLNMTIPKGAIYGLLGPSGCGKTTLLSCIVGKQRLHDGFVTVFGFPPGTRESGVPGKRLGYMPQELALYREFNIRETMQYFGRLYALPADKIKERTEFLIEFLNLPKASRLVGNLSGGQQRRVSLAAALLHEPELLILDEPTVGVDPLLRSSIWTHLLEISKSGKTTIVITTHYIEEARQANVVGMLRLGHLLAEGDPEYMMKELGKSTLEDVFLSLCQGVEADKADDSLTASPQKTQTPSDASNMCALEQGVGSDSAVPAATSTSSLADALKAPMEKVASQQQAKKTSRSLASTVTDALAGGAKKALASLRPSKKTSTQRKTSKSRSWADVSSSFAISNIIDRHRMQALLVKSFIRMWRNIGFLLFQFVVPTVQVALFCLAIGRDPQHLKMAIFNEDSEGLVCTSYSKGCIFGSNDDADMSETHRQNLSCRFLSYISPDLLTPVYFDSLNASLDKVRQGEYWGAMHFKKNYSEALYERMLSFGQVPDNKTLDESEAHIYLDMTNQQIGYTIQLRLTEAYQSFAKDLLETCQMSPELISVPLSFEEPVYGSNQPTFTEFMAPGVILSITYFMAVGLTSLSFITERKEGLLDRSWMAGVTATEVMLTHIITQFFVMIVQVALVIIFMIDVFQIPAKGPMVWIVLLTILQGVCGMAFGLVISAVCDDEQDAIQVALGSFYPNLLLSGIIWPLEGMPAELRYISYILPQTYACEAMRGILSRGWGLDWMPVYRGYLVTIAWTVFMLVLSAVILKIRR